jgi:hypothetical protein
MPTSTWLLTSASGWTFTITGSPLYLMYDSAGNMYLPSDPTPLPIAVAECTTDAANVEVDITTDDRSNGDLSEASSGVVKDPSTHTGTYTWQGFPNKRVLLGFSVPETSGTVWGWEFGSRPPIALKGKIKVKR